MVDPGYQRKLEQERITFSITDQLATDALYEDVKKWLNNIELRLFCTNVASLTRYGCGINRSL